MNLHITPSFNIDRLCKTASVLLFLVKQVFSTEILFLYPRSTFLSVSVFAHKFVQGVLYNTNMTHSYNYRHDLIFYGAQL